MEKRTSKKQWKLQDTPGSAMQMIEEHKKKMEEEGTFLSYEALENDEVMNNLTGNYYEFISDVSFLEEGLYREDNFNTTKEAIVYASDHAADLKLWSFKKGRATRRETLYSPYGEELSVWLYGESEKDIAETLSVVEEFARKKVGGAKEAITQEIIKEMKQSSDFHKRIKTPEHVMEILQKEGHEMAASAIQKTCPALKKKTPAR